LGRRKELREIVEKDWVRFFVRDPETGTIYKQSQGSYTPVKIDLEGSDLYMHSWVKPTAQLDYAHSVRRYEAKYTGASIMLALLACAVPNYLFWGEMLNPLGPIISMCGLFMTLCALAFSRRYLHGEFGFGRFVGFSASMYAGFSLVATAPSLHHMIPGWGIISFSSAFLIAAYNERPTACENATWAFGLYKLSGCLFLLAATFSKVPGYEAFVAVCLMIPAFIKSSQFPFTNLFMRSMEGPSPTSAIGYAGLSAHVGVVVLTNTMSFWFQFTWARCVVAAVGIITTIVSGLVCKIRADRKGALASAASSTIGVIFVILAAGYEKVALVLAFGHGTFRMMQVLRSPNCILDIHHLKAALRDDTMTMSKPVPEWVYRLCFRLNRFNVDLSMPNLLQVLSSHRSAWQTKLTKCQQWLVTSFLAVLAGLPFTPLSEDKISMLSGLLQSHLFFALCFMAFDAVVSVVFIRFVFSTVLDPDRFLHPITVKKTRSAESPSGALATPLLSKSPKKLGFVQGEFGEEIVGA
jgi:hypothetical protein